MAVIDDIIEPVRVRVPRRYGVLSVRGGDRGRLHLSQCRAAGRGQTRFFNVGNMDRLCKLCSTPAELAPETARVLADLLVLAAAAELEGVIRRPPEHYHPRALAEIRAMLDAADAYSGGSHPQGAQLAALLPEGAATPYGVAHSGHGEGGPALDPELLRVFTGGSAEGTRLWATVQKLVSGNFDPDLAVELAVDAAAHRGDPTVAMLPDALLTRCEDHRDAVAWMQHEWASAATAARATLTAQLRAHLDVARLRAPLAAMP